jgi:RHS repeat-associated protein
MDYNAFYQLTYRYGDPWADGTAGEERLSYTYDDNGNLTQVKTETYSGGWSETLRWDYQWDPRDQMKKASKYVNASLDGYVEYQYCLSCDGALSKRLKYDSSADLKAAWRYEYDGLNLLRIDEVYDADSDSDLDDDLAANHWRIRETSTHRPGQLAAQLGNRVYEHTDNNATPDGYADYTYAYDAVGNVVMLFDSAGNEEFHFAQDAFGNEVKIAAFGATPWDTAEAAGVTEHQTGKWLDPFTQLYYFQKRWYDAEVGRFTSRAPMPVSIEHPYTHVENSPLASVDPTGRNGGYKDIGKGWKVGKPHLDPIPGGGTEWGVKIVPPKTSSSCAGELSCKGTMKHAFGSGPWKGKMPPKRVLDYLVENYGRYGHWGTKVGCAVGGAFLVVADLCLACDGLDEVPPPTDAELAAYATCCCETSVPPNPELCPPAPSPGPHPTVPDPVPEPTPGPGSGNSQCNSCGGG